jgi:F-type H+-transporting ATPase subunit epsilon
MSEKEFLLRVVTPEKLFIDDLPVTLVEARGIAGDFGAMPGHEPFLTSLKPGIISYKPVGQSEKDDFHCDGGIIEVLPNLVTIIAEAVLTAEEVAEEAAEEAEREQAELERQIAELKSASASKEQKAKDKAERERIIAEHKKLALEGKQLFLELPPEEDVEDDIARLEIQLTKTVSRTHYAQKKKKFTKQMR